MDDQFDADAVLSSIDAATDRADGGAPVTLPAQALSLAAFDPEGHPRRVEALFARWFDPDEIGAALRDGVRDGPGLAVVATRGGGATVVLTGRAVDAAGWALEPDRTADLPSNALVALAYRPFEDRALAERAIASWRLTPAEARTVLGLVSAGDLIEGARVAGTGYETARKALKAALRKAGARRQTDLVRRLHTAVGGGDLQLSQAAPLQAALGLSPRAAGACVLLALGLTRGEAAATLQISEHAMKDELAALYARFGLRSATDLSRMTTEALVLLGVADNRNLALGVSWARYDRCGS